MPTNRSWSFIVRRLQRWSSYLKNQGQDKLAALPHILIQLEITAETDSKFFANVEPYAMTTLIHAFGGLIVGLEIHLEEILSIFRSNTDSLICYPNIDTDRAFLINQSELVDRNLNETVGFRKLKTVLNQVYYDLLSTKFVKKKVSVIF